MRPSDNVSVVRELYDAFARRDLEAALAVVDEDVDFRPYGTALLAERQEPYRGHEGIRRYFADVAEIWRELRAIPLDFRAAADSVIVFGTVHGDGPTGDAAATPVTWVWKLREGRIVSGRVFPTHGQALRWVETEAEAEAERG